MIRGKKEHNRPTRERNGSVLHSFPRIAAMIDGLDPVYGVPESRPVWKTRPIALGLTLFRRISLTLVAVALMVEGTHLGTWLTGRFDLDPALIAVWRYLRWGIGLASAVLAVELLYHFGPDLKQRFRLACPEPLWRGVRGPGSFPASCRGYRKTEVPPIPSKPRLVYPRSYVQSSIS